MRYSGTLSKNVLNGRFRQEESLFESLPTQVKVVKSLCILTLVNKILLSRLSSIHLEH